MTDIAAPRTAFINLPVKDLARSVEFFTALGFTFDPQATGDDTAYMVVGDGASVLLHVERFFREFTGSEIADTSTTREVAVGLSAVNREEVDELTDRAVAAGGQAVGVQDQGFMYMRAFRDLDGHQWSFIHLDMSAMGQQ
jgi:predicted lactoylglutathione lyase